MGLNRVIHSVVCATLNKTERWLVSQAADNRNCPDVLDDIAEMLYKIEARRTAISVRELLQRA